MPPTLRSTLRAAVLASLAVAAALALWTAVGPWRAPPYVRQWTMLVGGGGVSAAVLGTAAFVAIGTLWGVPFAWVRRRTVAKGMLYGLLPTAWALVAWPAILGMPLFSGGDVADVALVVGMNVLLWGGLLGGLSERARRPA